MRFVILWLLSWLLEVLAVVYFVYILLVYADFLSTSSAAALVPARLVFVDLLRTGVVCLGVVVGAESARVLIAIERHLARVRYSVQHFRQDWQDKQKP